jgi:hypothetical protein
MKKFDWSTVKPIPGFDSARWLRKVRAKTYEDTKDMTAEEVREYFRKRSEERRKEKKQS